MRCHRFLLGVLLAAFSVALYAQEYHGPPPPKADIPYLLHAEKLIETEVAEARPEDRKKVTAYVVPGAASPVRTPMAEPIFILLSEKIAPDQLRLYKMDVVNGHRETVFPKKRKKRPPRPRHLMLKKLEDNVYWIELNEWIENGEYCLTPQGSNQVFCFQVY